jgi:hypothetical protein
MDRRNKVRLRMLFPLLFVSRTLGFPSAASVVPGIVVRAARTWVLSRTTRLNSLVLTPDGSAAEANLVPRQGLDHPFRQATYVHDNGLVPATYVLTGTTGDKVTSGRTDDVRNVSTSAGFSGVSVREDDYALDSLPAGYQSTPDSHGRRDAPWMPDTPGNNRTTSLSGDTTRTSYRNSSVSSHGSPALPVGQARNRRPTATDGTVTTNRVPTATIPGTIHAGSITPAVH